MTILGRVRSRGRAHFGDRRLAHFRRLFPEDSWERAVDLGGTIRHWETLGYGNDVVILNTRIRPDTRAAADRYHLVEGDARCAPFASASVDLAFSNSVIEHVGGWDDQQRFAGEMLRVGRRLYCQTPNRRFFVEPHLLAPLLHWLPRRWQRYPMIRWCTLWGLSKKPDRAEAEAFLRSIRLLSKREFERLFPGCQIFTERFLLVFAKSFIAVSASD